MTEVELKERLANTDKIQAELQKLVSENSKLVSESSKLIAESLHIEKKNKWFEFTLMLAVIAATVAVTKLFL